MRDHEFTARLRAGAESLAAAADPPSPDVIRRRGDRRRTHGMIAAGVLVFVTGAGGGGAAYASLGAPSGAPQAAGAGASQAQSAAASAVSGASRRIVAVTTGGAVELLDASSGVASKVLVPRTDAIGDEIAVSPSGSTVYFAVKRGCADSIESVPVTGGTALPVATGVLPAISPDGARLAFVRERISGGSDAISYGCQPAGIHPAGQVSVVVRDLATGHEKVYGTSAVPISHLSWSPSGQSLLVSAGPGVSGGWVLSTLDVATGGSRAVPVTGAASYYREGVFLPGGGLFVDRVCCSGDASTVSSTVLQEIDASGGLVRQVAIGYVNRDHTSLDVSAGWLLYLSGHDLFVADGTGKAYQVTSGLIAAAWLGA